MFLWVTERPTAEEMEETATWKDEIVGGLSAHSWWAEEWDSTAV
jgi:hypothetical protein